MPYDVVAFTERQQLVLGILRADSDPDGMTPTQIGRKLGFHEKEASSKVMNALAKLVKHGRVTRTELSHSRDVRYRYVEKSA